MINQFSMAAFILRNVPSIPPSPQNTESPPPPPPVEVPLARHESQAPRGRGGFLHTLMRVTAICVVLVGIGLALRYLYQNGYVPQFGAAPAGPEQPAGTETGSEPTVYETEKTQEPSTNETTETENTADENTEVTLEEPTNDTTVTGSGSEVIPSGNEDTDGDGILNYIEVRLGTDLNSSDTDQDGITDRDEMLQGSNPILAE